MPSCECEHEDHFGGTAHRYEGAPAKYSSKTPWGTFKICEYCKDRHYGKEYPTRKLTFEDINPEY
jgi:hypothetical protein